jgi:Spy/CpxP family protein refolding chaperone
VKRAWFLLLAVSIGLNAALLWHHLEDRRTMRHPEWREQGPERGPGRGARGPGARDPRGPGRGPGHDVQGDGPPSYEAMVERRIGHMTRQLDLSDAQVTRLRSIATASFGEMDSLRAAARIERGRIRDLLSAGEVDAQAVRASSARLSAIDAAMEARITENMILEAAVLDPAQRSRYLDLMRFAGPPGRRGPPR